MRVRRDPDGATVPVGPRLEALLGGYLELPSASEWLGPGRGGDAPLANMRLRGWRYTSHQLRYKFSSLATRAAGAVHGTAATDDARAVPGIGQVYTHAGTLLERLRSYAAAIEGLVAGEGSSLFGWDGSADLFAVPASTPENRLPI